MTGADREVTTPDYDVSRMTGGSCSDPDDWSGIVKLNKLKPFNSTVACSIQSIT